MSARKFHNSWWVDFRFNDVRYRKRSPENSKVGATSYEVALRQRLAKGDPINGEKEVAKELPTFKEFSETWFRTYVLTNNKFSEQTAKRGNLNKHLIPFFGETPIDAISGFQVEQYKSVKLKSRLSPKSINNHLSTLAKCLRCAQEWLGLNRIPTIKLLKVPPQRFDFLTTDESQQLLQAIENPMWYAMVLLALRSGLRVGELFGLEWKDIELGSRQLTVRRSIVNGVTGSPKNNRERHVPLSEQVYDALSKLRAGGGAVFRRKKGGPFRNRNIPHRKLHHFCKRAGLRPIGWHTLRHTFASQLSANCVPIRTIQELLGHSDIKTTMRYTHVSPSNLIEAIGTLEEIDSRKSGQQVGNRLVTQLEST